MVNNETAQNVHEAIERSVNESLDASIVIGARGSLNTDVQDCVFKSMWVDENKLLYGLVGAFETEPKFESLVLRALTVKNVIDNGEY